MLAFLSSGVAEACGSIIFLGAMDAMGFIQSESPADFYTGSPTMRRRSVAFDQFVTV
jgi:hypothetical protein